MTLLDDQPAVIGARPSAEGCNIRTWVGFKHFTYLAEESVREWFRQRGFGQRRLFHEQGLGLAVVGSSLRLPAVLEADDIVVAEASRRGPTRFAVRLEVERGGGREAALTGKLDVALVPLGPGTGAGSEPATSELPEDLRAFVASGDGGRASRAGEAPEPAFVWEWRVPYFYCEYSSRMQHAGYVRALEEVVDRFLFDRGISVARMLDERGWIPVVSRARIEVLAEARMEEVLRTTFSVTDVLKEMCWEGRMDCYVEREGVLVHTASASILHGYARSRGEHAGTLAPLDGAVLEALTGDRR